MDKISNWDEALEEMIYQSEDFEHSLTGQEPWYQSWLLYRNHLVVAKEYLEDLVE